VYWFVPQATKGRKAHPPKTEKVWKKGMNKKERMKALSSAIAATANKELALSRGHRAEGIKHLPLVIEKEMEGVKKAKNLIEFLKAFGLEREMERVKERKVRSGKGTKRGRKYKGKRGLVIIVSEYGGIEKAAGSLPGIDVVKASELKVGHLAPGGRPGRLAIWSEAALEQIEKELKG